MHVHMVNSIFYLLTLFCKINNVVIELTNELLTYQKNDYKLLNHYTTLLGDFRKETTGIYEITPNFIFYFNK